MKNLLRITLLLLAATLPAQSLKTLYAESTKAYQGKDYPHFLQLTRTLDSLRPSHPVYTYNLACAFALNNQPGPSLAALRKAVLMDSKTDFAQEADLAALKNLPEFTRLLRLKSTMEALVAHSQKAAVLSEKDLHPEGLTYLPKAKTWLVASIRKRKISTFDPVTGQCSDWLKDNMLSVFALKADKDERFLWAATAAMPEMEGYAKEMEGRAEILQIDLKTRQVVRRFTVPGNHIFGDLAVSDNSTVYISDSSAPVVYQIKEGVISPWLRFPGGIYNLQGLALDKAREKIYLADYFRGIAAIPLSHPQDYQWLEFPEDTTVKGIDGLVFYGNSLVAVHNGVKPIRVVQYFLSEGSLISGYKVIDQNRPEFNEPALAAVKDGKLFFFANAPWNAYDKDGNLVSENFSSPELFTCQLSSKP
jgi:hypothetical protein